MPNVEVGDLDQQVVKDEESDSPSPVIPEELPILPLRGVVVYPLMVLPLTVGQTRSVRLIDDVAVGDRLVGLVASKDPEIDEPTPDEVYQTGTAALIHRLIKSPDGTIPRNLISEPKCRDIPTSCLKRGTLSLRH